MQPRIGDRVTLSGSIYPPDYPLVVLVVCGGRCSIGSPRWPKGAGYPAEFHEIASINGSPVEFQAIKQIKKRKTA